VCALSGLGGVNDVSRVQGWRWNKKFEKHYIRGRPTRSSIEMLKGYMAKGSLGTPGLVKRTFFYSTLL